jgi:hypothetical protein
MVYRTASCAPQPEFYVVLRTGAYHWFQDRTLAEVFFASDLDARDLVDTRRNIYLKRRRGDDPTIRNPRLSCQ